MPKEICYNIIKKLIVPPELLSQIKTSKAVRKTKENRSSCGCQSNIHSTDCTSCCVWSKKIARIRLPYSKKIIDTIETLLQFTHSWTSLYSNTFLHCLGKILSLSSSLVIQENPGTKTKVEVQIYIHNKLTNFRLISSSNASKRARKCAEEKVYHC